ncbi:hypothetical protein [Blastococcus mobilis]|uniref:Uncharacterized protein n=1 Tax=Blastococcus mobilis TaxID=1938746 RepID=A0A238ZR76_9ACTN|nr:hypothetical protein [Blastococcus mobilis]SNR85865.1 hypothetical protein SAMN06272737_13212 [Blastococcus mobilis]
MPEPIIRTASSAARAVPRQRGRPRPPLVRQLREQDWRTLVGTYRLLSRLVVERTKHHLIDDADSFARDAVLVEKELERDFPFRWARRRSELLLEQSTWWAQPHEDDPLSCRACQLQLGRSSDRATPPPRRRVGE